MNWYKYEGGKDKLKIPYGICLYKELCSCYAERVLHDRGLIKGSLLAFIRIIRCNKLSLRSLSPLYDECPQNILSDDLQNLIKPKVRMVYRSVGYWKDI